MRCLLFLLSPCRQQSEVAPTEVQLQERARYTEAMVKNGILLDHSSVRSSADRLRVWPDQGQVVVEDDPRDGSHDLTCHWMIDVKSSEEAVEWARRCPWLHHVEGAMLKVRLLETAL